MVVLSSATGRNERATLVGLGTLQHACVVVAKIPSTAVFPGGNFPKFVLIEANLTSELNLCDYLNICNKKNKCGEQ